MDELMGHRLSSLLAMTYEASLKQKRFAFLDGYMVMYMLENAIAFWSLSRVRSRAPRFSTVPRHGF